MEVKDSRKPLREGEREVNGSKSGNRRGEVEPLGFFMLTV